MSREDQVIRLDTVLARPDLTRGQRILLLDMRAQVVNLGVVLGDPQERMIQGFLEKPLPPAAWRPMGKTRIALWVGGVVVALVVFQLLLDLLLHALNWR
jgi:hypothetical protein